MSEMTIENSKGECVWRLCYAGELTEETMGVLNAMNEYSNHVYHLGTKGMPAPFRCRLTHKVLEQAFYDSLDASLLEEVQALEEALRKPAKERVDCKWCDGQGRIARDDAGFDDCHSCDATGQETEAGRRLWDRTYKRGEE